MEINNQILQALKKVPAFFEKSAPFRGQAAQVSSLQVSVQIGLGVAKFSGDFLYKTVKLHQGYLKTW
ncbi:hypothetical protein ACQKNS_00115 [Peribacillus sp. NPDC094092]|uniref:hypothetical protein n=1 Tax=Peribacillus sp. NPDC094092 TaxID=3390611 RepID=UPI003D04FF8B